MKCLKHQLIEEVPGRGFMTYYAYKTLADESNLTEENLNIARYVGWCNKLLEASFQITDDIVDGAMKRHNLPCWHTLPEVGKQVANDIAMVTLVLFPVLERIVGHKDYYPKLLKTFMDGGFSCYLGQSLDHLHCKQSILNHNREFYDRIITLKACIYASYGPIAMALDMIGCRNPLVYENAREVAFEIGRAWQVRNDYIDCFQTATNITHTDVQEKKLTWLTVNFMERASPDQINIMESCYGKDDAEKVEQVQKLFEQVGMTELYNNYLQKSYNNVNQMIEDSPYDKLKPVFTLFRDQIFKEYRKT